LEDRLPLHFLAYFTIRTGTDNLGFGHYLLLKHGSSCFWLISPQKRRKSDGTANWTSGIGHRRLIILATVAVLKIFRPGPRNWLIDEIDGFMHSVDGRVPAWRKRLAR